jgi:hypothetical protein
LRTLGARIGIASRNTLWPCWTCRTGVSSRPIVTGRPLRPRGSRRALRTGYALRSHRARCALGPGRALRTGRAVLSAGARRSLRACDPLRSLVARRPAASLRSLRTLRPGHPRGALRSPGAGVSLRALRASRPSFSVLALRTALSGRSLLTTLAFRSGRALGSRAARPGAAGTLRSRGALRTGRTFQDNGWWWRPNGYWLRTRCRVTVAGGVVRRDGVGGLAAFLAFLALGPRAAFLPGATLGLRFDARALGLGASVLEPQRGEQRDPRGAQRAEQLAAAAAARRRRQWQNS